MWGWKTMYVFQWFCMWSYDGIKLQERIEKYRLETVNWSFIPLHVFVSIPLINNLLHSACLPLLLTVFISLSLALALSVLGRVFLPRPLMAFFSASSIQAWPSPLKNTSLSLVPLLATTQVQGWWTSILRTHFLCVHLWIRSHLHYDWQWF